MARKTSRQTVRKAGAVALKHNRTSKTAAPRAVRAAPKAPKAKPEPPGDDALAPGAFEKP